MRESHIPMNSKPSELPSDKALTRFFVPLALQSASQGLT